MSDPTETIRRKRCAELSAERGEREVLEERHGKVWDTQEMQAEFDALGFQAPLIVVSRKSDGVKGSLEFQSSPRLYFNWKEDK